MRTFTIRRPRSQAASLSPSARTLGASIPERDKQRDKQAALGRLLMLGAPSIAILAIVAHLILKLAWADGAPLQCFLLRGDAALRACQKVIASDWPPEVRADAYYNLGVALADVRRWADARDAFLEAVRLNPADADALYNTGLMLGRLHRYEGALQAYDAAVRVRPDYADAWGNLGMTAYLLGRYRESMEAFDRARMLVPNYFDGRDAQRKAWQQSRQGQPRWLEHP